MKKNQKFIYVHLLMFTAFMLVSATAHSQGAKVDFSGKWALNAEKSNFGQAPQGGGQRPGGFGGDFVARQEPNLLTVERTRTGQDGQQITTTSKYTLDGNVSVNSTGRGESKSTANWSADGKSLTIVTTRVFERDGQSTEIKTTEVWTLTNPALLTITSTMATPNGARTTTAVYDKKQ